jgi:hypothetical protein
MQPDALGWSELNAEKIGASWEPDRDTSHVSG